jgi:hypothetical protein
MAYGILLLATSPSQELANIMILTVFLAQATLVGENTTEMTTS